MEQYNLFSYVFFVLSISIFLCCDERTTIRLSLEKAIINLIVVFLSFRVGFILVLFSFYGRINKKLVNQMCRISKNVEFGYHLKLCLKLQYLLFFLMEGRNMKGLRFDKPHTYFCKCDEGKPDTEKTKFQVRFLTAKEQAKLRDQMYSVSGVGASRNEKFLTGTSALMALEMGLLGWSNFKFDDTGEEIPFNATNFSCIPPKERDEIANYIRGAEESE